MRVPSLFVLLLSLGLVVVVIPFADAGMVNRAGSITFFDLGAGEAYSYKAQIVFTHENIGSLQLLPYHRLVINVMLPPEGYTDLCEYPFNFTTTTANEENANSTLSPTAHSNLNESLLENTTTSIPIEFDFSPIALLVPLQRRKGSTNVTDCDVLTKIKVALRYQREVIQDRQLWSIIFYNTHGDESDKDDEGNMHGNSSTIDTRNARVYSMEFPDEFYTTDIPGLDSLIMATVSHKTGMMMREKIKSANEAIRNYHLTGDNTTVLPYYLLNKGNPNWQFPASLERGADAPFRETNSEMNDEDDNDNWATFPFFWIRFFLIIFICAFPFVQCFRMWLSAGGRIGVRRNRRGWIIGLVYHPARSNWYDIGASVRHQTTTTSRGTKLTEEQVLALPEIEYEGRPEGSDVGDKDQNDNGGAEVNLGSVDVIDDSTKENSEQEKGYTREEGGSHTESNAIESASDGQDVHGECTHKAADRPSFTANMSTVCSICIEEFEHGEKIRLLPRCGHAFHTDCILPWLTERQGYCPFCKTDVLDIQESPVEGEEAQQSQEGNDTGDDSRQPNV